MSLVMRQDDGDHSTQRSTHRLEYRDAFANMFSHFSCFFRSQACRLVKDLPAGVEFADVVEQSCRSNIVGSTLVEAQPVRDTGGVKGNTIRMIVCIFVVGNELLKNRQYSKVGSAQFSNVRFLPLIQGPHGISGDDEEASPHGEIKPVV